MEAGGTLVFVERLPATCVDGSSGDYWYALRTQAEQALPRFVNVGLGRIGFAPQGVDAAIGLVKQVCEPDLRVTLGSQHEQFVTRHEWRGGPTRAAVVRPVASALKYYRRRVDASDLYFVVNESAQTLEATLDLRGSPHVERWLFDTGERQRIPSLTHKAGQCTVALTFAPYESYLLVVGESERMVEASQALEWQLELETWDITVGAVTQRGQLASWSALGLMTYAGLGQYHTTFDLPAPVAHGQQVMLDLGTVFETAQVCINNHTLPPLARAPYTANNTLHLRTGANELHITIANTNVGAFEQIERTAGLLGPVKLRCYQQKAAQ